MDGKEISHRACLELAPDHQVDRQLEDQAGARWVDTQAGAPQYWMGTMTGAPQWIGTTVVEPQKWIGTTVGAQWDWARLQPPVQRGPACVKVFSAFGIVMVLSK